MQRLSGWPVVCAALVVVGLWGCTVPPLEELERERPRACDPGGCLEGYECRDGVCVKPEPVGPDVCEPGETQACGLDVGACKLGTRTCGEDRKLGECFGAVGPQAESCNGIDDDCDGATDESLEKLCAVQQGVCTGAKVLCLDGAFAECGFNEYRARDTRYQVYETLCDGADNDCDGRVDAWAPQDVKSPGEMQAARRAQLAQTGETTLLAYESGTTIRVRPVGVDGRLGEPVAPVPGVDDATSASGVVMETAAPDDGGTRRAYAAWVEERQGVWQVRVAELGPTGTSVWTKDGEPQALVLQPTMGRPGALALAATAKRLHVAVSLQLTGSQQPPIEVWMIDVGAPTQPPVRHGVGAPGSAGIRPSLYVAPNGVAYLAFEAEGGVQVWRVDEDGGASPAPTIVGQAGASFPQLTWTSVPGANYAIWHVSPDRRRIETWDCGAPPCTYRGNRPPLGNSGELENLRVRSQSELDTLLTWDQTGTSFTGAVVLPLGANLTSFPAHEPDVKGRRPVALQTGDSLFIAYDTEGVDGTGVSADTVLLQRMCLP